MRSNKSILRTICGVNFSKNRANLHLRIGEIENTLEVIVVKNNEFNYDLLLGLDAIQKFKLIQDENLQIYQRIGDKIILVTKDCKTQFPCQSSKSKPAAESDNYFSVSEKRNLIENLSHLEPVKQREILNLLTTHEDCFAKGKFDVGLVKTAEARIKLKEEKYISKKPYRCSFTDQEEIDSQISELLKADLIEESSSPFASPVTLAFKKDGEKKTKTRLCVDFRELNKLVVPEPQPFPRIDDLVVSVGDCHWFTALDINSAFWSIPLRQKDRSKTAFITQTAHWQWKVLPFGYKNSPAIFQRTLASIIRKHDLRNFCVNYIDDILIFSKSYDEHMEHVKLVLGAVIKEGFKVKLSKCKFAQHSIKYLGHVIEKNKVYPIKDNLIAINNFPRPKTKKMVRQLLGKINFYHKFIDNCTQRLSPLHNLLKKDQKFVWTDECESSFLKVKEYLCSTPILAIYDREKDTVIEVDASRQGLGAVLKQRQAGGDLHPVGYFSKKLTPGQAKKEIMYLECLGIKEAIIYWQHYLIGKSFTVISDHKPLINLKTKSRTDEALGDLMLYLSQFNFKVIYRAGKENLEADSLSRNPVLESFENDDEVIKLVNIMELQDIISDQRSIQTEIGNDDNIIQEGDVIFKTINNRKRIYVSKMFGLELIRKVHQFYGHIGSRQIAEKLRSFYYFKSMDKMIVEFTRNCDVCIKNKTRFGTKNGLMSKLGPAEFPFHVISLDTIGGFAGHRSPKRYMHLLVDHFTRYAWISTSSTQSTKDFINLIDPIIRSNKVHILLADQYSSLTSNEFKNYLRRHNVKLVFTSVDNPQSNGLNERLNQTLVNRIRCKLNDQQNRIPWPKIATECLQEYNKTVHSSTRYSPAYLMYGQNSPIIPAELDEGSNLEHDRARALCNSQNSFYKNKRRFDRNRKQQEFNMGDLVFVADGNRLNKSKLSPIRAGPFPILRKISNSIYEVQTAKKRKESNYFHVSKLVPYSFSPKKTRPRRMEV